MFSNLGGGGLFGQPQQQQGQQQQQGGGIFPQQAQQGGGALFGAPNPTQAIGGMGGMIGQQQPQQGGLFGGNQQQQGTAGLFGGPQQQQQQQQQGLFGAPISQQPSALFGQQQQTGQGGTGGFGAGGMFGQPQQQPLGGNIGGFNTAVQPTTSLFGGQQPQGFSGAQGFNQQPVTPNPQSVGFGGLFAQQQPYGQPPQQPQQPQAAFSGFTQQNPGLFGQQQNPIPQQNAGALFGQQRINPPATTTPTWGGAGGNPIGQAPLAGVQALPGHDDSVNDINMDPSCTKIEDSISFIVWNLSNQRFLAAGTWEGRVRVYEIVQNLKNLQRNDLQERRIYQIENSQPPAYNSPAIPNAVLCLDWKPDGSIIFVGTGIDNTVRALQVATGQNAVVGQHNGPVIGVFWAESAQVLISVSIDMTMRIWNINSPGQATYTMNFQYKPLLADMNYPLLLVGFAGEKLTIINLSQLNLIKNPHYFDSSLGLNSRLTAMQIFPARDGFGIGSVDGRGHMSNITLKPGGFNGPQHYDMKAIMTFKAHKVEDSQGASKINYFFPVNSVQFNSRNPKFMMTAGAEGQMVFWDYDAKNKIKTFQYNAMPIVTAKMSPDGKFLAYALGNDFSKGPESYSMNIQNKLCVHSIPDNELKCAAR